MDRLKSRPNLLYLIAVRRQKLYKVIVVNGLLAKPIFRTKMLKRLTKHVITPDGNHLWFVNGKHHREDGPAHIEKNGTQRWLQYDIGHRIDGPAIIFASGSQTWFLNGLRHRVDGPAQTTPDGYEAWYLNGEYHRENGPALTYPSVYGINNGTQMWLLNGKIHRIGGPAVMREKGELEWWEHGKLIRRENEN